MHAHWHDLRAEVGDDLATAVRSDWRRARLGPRTAALLEYAERLTRAPASAGESDIQRLLEAGWTDRAVHDTTQVVAFFNYINRIAEGLGVDPEPLDP